MGRCAEMYIKPQHENPKPKQKPENQLDPALLSRDYLLENGKMTILPVDFVIEHGKNFDDEDINRDNILTGGISVDCYMNYISMILLHIIHFMKTA